MACPVSIAYAPVYRITTPGYDILNNRVISTALTTSGGSTLRTCFDYDDAGNQSWVFYPRFTASSCPAAQFDDDTNRLYDDGTYTHGVLKHIFGGEH